MKRYINFLLILIASILISGCGEEEVTNPPVKIETLIHTESYGVITMKIPQVIVTAIDEVTVQKIIINEGNGCRPVSNSQLRLPKAMKFGDQIRQTYTAKCNVIKVEVITDKGDWAIQY